MIIKSIALANFRKFREPLRVEGFGPGLNIVVEPNESGKSTLLEALRAALFIRHSAKTELVRSYVPIGDEVAPRVAVEFSAAGQDWHLEKQFIRSPFVRLTGGSIRRESDAAEDALQTLLGFERGNNRGSDDETRGPLGFLWVEQATALQVDRPNAIVRDTVRGVVESEVGVVTGGRRFDAIRESVETAYAALRTPRTGQSRGALAQAEVRVTEAAAARQAADTTLRSYDEALGQLETAKARLRIVERDLADAEAAKERQQLNDDLKLAESATLRLSAAEAHHGQAVEIARTALARVAALRAAEARVGDGEVELDRQRKASAALRGRVQSAVFDEKARRAELDAERAGRSRAEAALALAQHRARTFAVGAAARRAIDARDALVALEERESALQAEADRAINVKDLERLADLDRALIEATARFEAGSVKIDFDLAAGVSLSVDGRPTDAATLDILATTELRIGDAGSITVRPPAGTGRSIEADMAAAETALGTALADLGVGSHALAVTRSERAAAAARELAAVCAQISAACPGDPTIGLAKGADALRAFVLALDKDQAALSAPTDDLVALETVVSDSRTAEAAALGRHDNSRDVLAAAERAYAVAAAALATAMREQEVAVGHLREILEDGSLDNLEAALAEAERDRVARLDALETARAGAKAFDATAIRKRMDNMDRAAARGGEERIDYAREIASLEATIAREGTAGPASLADAAREEEEAALSAYERLREEADVLNLLRRTLTDAADQASRAFLAPVTRRASRYIERLLPGCALSFDEELGLAKVLRAGLDEACSNLSRGTQEQLGILTRLAFADLLLENGAPISLILDDPLVYSDDARLETMTEILQEAAQRMQVILLTCRTKAFRHVDCNRLTLT